MIEAGGEGERVGGPAGRGAAPHQLGQFPTGALDPGASKVYSYYTCPAVTGCGVIALDEIEPAAPGAGTGEARRRLLARHRAVPDTPHGLLTALGVADMMHTLRRRGVRYVESNRQLEDNKTIHRLWQRFNMINRRRSRVYRKDMPGVDRAERSSAGPVELQVEQLPP